MKAVGPDHLYQETQTTRGSWTPVRLRADGAEGKRLDSRWQSTPKEGPLTVVSFTSAFVSRGGRKEDSELRLDLRFSGPGVLGFHVFRVDLGVGHERGPVGVLGARCRGDDNRVRDGGDPGAAQAPSGGARDDRSKLSGQDRRYLPPGDLGEDDHDSSSLRDGSSQVYPSSPSLS